LDTHDTELAAQVLLGRNPRLFGELVRAHQSRVRNFLRRLLRDESLADDLAQETFIKAWDKLDGFTGKGSFGGWVMKIAYNEFLQYRRKLGQDQRLERQVQDSMLAGQAACQVEAADGAGSDLERVLSGWSEPERLALTLAYGFGMSHSEIAEVTGMAVGTIKSHISRGKARVHELFPGEGAQGV